MPLAPKDDWATFHMVFSKTVPDTSFKAVANLGYAEGCWLTLIFTGDTAQSVSEVIELKKTQMEKPVSSNYARAG